HWVTWPALPEAWEPFAFAPFADLFAASGPDKLVRLWRISGDGHEEVDRLSGARGPMDFCPKNNRRTLACGTTENSLCLWEFEPPSGLAPQLLRRSTELPRFPGPLTAIAFSPDGNVLATSGNGAVLLWDLTDGDLLHQDPRVIKYKEEAVGST